MANSELLIPNPAENPTPLSAYSLYKESFGPGHFFDMKSVWLVDEGKPPLLPQYYPRVVDLCSGRGSIAQFLVTKGWDPTNILNIDMYKLLKIPGNIQGSSWMYMDLKKLATMLSHSQVLDARVETLRKQFDLVTMFHPDNPDLSRDDEKQLVTFFCKEGGAVLVVS